VKGKKNRIPNFNESVEQLENGNMDYFQYGNMSGNTKLGSAPFASADTKAKVVFSRQAFNF